VGKNAQGIGGGAKRDTAKGRGRSDSEAPESPVLREAQNAPFKNFVNFRKRLTF
jgi:hypothetical protein